MAKFGVIGFGSIGKRHALNLVTLGQSDITLLREIGSGNPYGFQEVSNLKELLSSKIDAIILANPTSMHAAYLHPILDNNLHVLAEKPLVSSEADLKLLVEKLKDYSGIGMTAYNMRFHPCIQKTHAILKAGYLGKIYSARFYVGQYLPDWRPNVKYANSYSAKRDMGGGVILDLIHEIDLACFLIGEPVGALISLVDKVSDLDIDTEDLAEILYRTELGSMVSIHLDYLTQRYQRYIEVMAEQGTLRVDLFQNQITLSLTGEGSKSFYFPQFDKNQMYLDLLASFLKSVGEDQEASPTLTDGLISNRIALDIRSKYYGSK